MSSYENAIRTLWAGLCDVYIRETVVNPANGRNEPTEVQTLHNEPCRLSFSTIASNEENSEAAVVKQVVKLFIAKTASVPPGSKIVVTQNGEVATYERSGKPAFYRYHQEIVLVPFKGWV